MHIRGIAVTENTISLFPISFTRVSQYILNTIGRRDKNIDDNVNLGNQNNLN